MPLPALRGDFRGHHPAHRLCSRNRELHVPEVRFGGDKLHSNVLFAVARPVNRYNAALYRLCRVIVLQNHRLAHQQDLFKLEQRTVPVHRLRMRLCAEPFA